MRRKLAGVLLIGHGLAHTLAGMRATEGAVFWSMTLAWALAFIGFAAAGCMLLGVRGLNGSWRRYAIGGLVGSEVLLVLGWTGPLSAAAGLAVDALILGAVLATRGADVAIGGIGPLPHGAEDVAHHQAAGGGSAGRGEALVMSRGVIGLVLVLPGLLLLGACTGAEAQVSPRPRPAGVTDSSIAWGRQLFHGSANCAGCHGVDARGTDEGPALTGALWFHGPGTYEWLIEQIKRGIPAHHTWTGKPMPMRGWSNMPDDDVRAVAAYVWSITHPPKPPPRTPRPS